MDHNPELGSSKLFTAFSDREAHPQLESSLFKLPRELRDQVYSHLFTSVVISPGLDQTALSKSRGVRWLSSRQKSRPSPLSLLQTCHRIRREVGTSWLSLVLVHFDCAKIAMDKLANLPPQLDISAIRRIRLRSCDVEFKLPNSDPLLSESRVGVANLLRYLPLQRHSLILIDSLATVSLYEDISCQTPWRSLMVVVRPFDPVLRRPSWTTFGTMSQDLWERTQRVWWDTTEDSTVRCFRPSKPDTVPNPLGWKTEMELYALFDQEVPAGPDSTVKSWAYSNHNGLLPYSVLLVFEHGPQDLAKLTVDSAAFQMEMCEVTESKSGWHELSIECFACM